MMGSIVLQSQCFVEGEAEMFMFCVWDRCKVWMCALILLLDNMSMTYCVRVIVINLVLERVFKLTKVNKRQKNVLPIYLHG